MPRDLVERANLATIQINWADGLNLSTPVFGKGRLFTLAGLHHDFLVVNQNRNARGVKTILYQQT